MSILGRRNRGILWQVEIVVCCLWGRITWCLFDVCSVCKGEIVGDVCLLYAYGLSSHRLYYQISGITSKCQHTKSDTMCSTRYTALMHVLKVCGCGDSESGRFLIRWTIFDGQDDKNWKIDLKLLCLYWYIQISQMIFIQHTAYF